MFRKLFALIAFPIAIAVLWTLPSARAQILYVINQPRVPGPEVREYNANTGELIRSNFITGLSSPTSLALLDKTLFVADFYSKRVGAYNADTGEVINATFITGLSAPVALAVSDHDNKLFVADSYSASGGYGSVGKYDAKTGAAIDANFIPMTGISTAVTLFRKTLFVAYYIDVLPPATSIAWVGAYNADTGEVINASFISGLILPLALAVSDEDNALFVADFSLSRVVKYNANTGLLLQLFFNTPRPEGLASSGNNHLFVAEQRGAIFEFIGQLEGNIIAGLDNPTALAFRSAQ